MTKAALDAYLAEDRIARLLTQYAREGDDDLTCQKWLRTTPAKRLIFDRLYGDLIAEGLKRHVLDVGGGLTSFTRRMAATQDYELVDFLAHDPPTAAEAMEAEIDRPFVSRMDWYVFEPKSTYDVVIANDLFPNVDQRLALFVKKFLPFTREIRLSLTYYNTPRYYMTRRIDGNEILCMLALDGEATARVLRRFAERIAGPDLELLSTRDTSIFPNGRDVCLLHMRGDLATASSDQHSSSLGG